MGEKSADGSSKSLDKILEGMEPSRRNFIRRSLVIGGAAVLAAPSSTVLAQATQPGTGGKGKGKGQGGGQFQGGKGKGKGSGKGSGKGQGKGNGKGKGSGKGKGKGNNPNQE